MEAMDRKHIFFRKLASGTPSCAGDTIFCYQPNVIVKLRKKQEKTLRKDRRHWVVSDACRIKDEPDANLVICSQYLPCLRIPTFLWLFLPKTKGEAISAVLPCCPPGEWSGALHQSLHAWGALVCESTEQFQISCSPLMPVFVTSKLIPLFLTHTPLFILPSLEHTQQFPHSYYIEAPTAAKAAHRATAASSPSFLLLRYVFFH